MPSSKLEEHRTRLRRQNALDLREVLKTPHGKRVIARQLHRAGTYSDAAGKLARGRRLLGLELERDVLRVSGERVLAELRHIIFEEFAAAPSAPSTEVVYPTGESLA